VGVADQGLDPRRADSGLGGRPVDGFAQQFGGQVERKSDSQGTTVHLRENPMTSAAQRRSGLVTATIDELRRARANQVSCCRDGRLPLRRRFGSEGPQRGPGDEVALKIERVVDGGMDTEEALRGSS